MIQPAGLNAVCFCCSSLCCINSSGITQRRNTKRVLVCINCFHKPHLARGTDVSAVRTEVNGDYSTVVRSQHSSKRVLLCRAVRFKYNEREGETPKARTVSC